jgi:hypothetical protein
MEDPTIDPLRIIGKASAETLLLINFLETIQVGQVVTYQEMELICKLDVQEHNSILGTARRSLMRRQQKVFGTVRGVGIRLLNDSEIAELGPHFIKRMRRAAAKGAVTLGCADISKISEDDRMKVFTTRTILAFAHKAGSQKSAGQIEQAVRIANHELNIGDLSKLFK